MTLISQGLLALMAINFSLGVPLLKPKPESALESLLRGTYIHNVESEANGVADTDNWAMSLKAAMGNIKSVPKYKVTKTKRQDAAKLPKTLDTEISDLLSIEMKVNEQEYETTTQTYPVKSDLLTAMEGQNIESNSSSFNFLSHARHKRSTNDTSASTNFLDDPDKVAMFIVLPCIVFVYGGCICIYCVHKCQDYFERVEPLKTFKRKVLGFPSEEKETSEAENRNFKHLFVKRRRPTSSKSLPDPGSTQQKEFDKRSIFSDAGISYDRDYSSGTANSILSEIDIDSGVHSDNDRVILVNTDSPDVRTLTDMTVEVKHVSTSEMAVQTDTIKIISSANLAISTCDASTTMDEEQKPSSKKSKKGSYGNVGSRYLNWLHSARELREVLNSNMEPRTLHEILRHTSDNEEGSKHSKNDQKEVQGKSNKVKETKLGLKKRGDSLIMSTESYTYETTYKSIHKKKASLLKRQSSKVASSTVYPLETRTSSASTSISRESDSSQENLIRNPQSGNVNSYKSMFRRKPNPPPGSGGAVPSVSKLPSKVGEGNLWKEGDSSV